MRLPVFTSLSCSEIFPFILGICNSDNTEHPCPMLIVSWVFLWETSPSRFWVQVFWVGRLLHTGSQPWTLLSIPHCVALVTAGQGVQPELMKCAMLCGLFLSLVETVRGDHVSPKEYEVRSWGLNLWKPWLFQRQLQRKGLQGEAEDQAENRMQTYFRMKFWAIGCFWDPGCNPAWT